MTRIKICGLTRAEDAMLASELGADAVGFVFAPRSKRRADPETVAAIVRLLPPFVTAVGVFQDQPLEEVRGIVAECVLHLAQLHGGEDRGYAEALGVPVLKAFSISTREDLTRIEPFAGLGGILLDSGAGGTGETFDWSLAAEAAKSRKIVLAGGLTPENVAEAIATVRPWGVDVAGGVESSPGIKDHHKMRAFFRNVRAADARLERQ